MKNLKFTQTRRLLLNFFIASAVLFITYSCSESEPDAYVSPQPYKCATCKTQSDAKPEYDNNYKGIYIGVTSTGSLLVNVMNSGEKLTATLIKNGVKTVFSAESIVADKNVYHAVFYGTYNGAKVSFDFRVNGDGRNPNLSSGYFPELKRINKETSKSMLEVFEGTYTVKAVSILVKNPDEGKVIDSLGETYIKGKYSMVISRYKPLILEAKIDPSSKGRWNGVLLLNGKSYYYGGTINQDNQLIDGSKRYFGTLNADSVTGGNIFLDNLFRNAYLVSRRVL